MSDRNFKNELRAVMNSVFGDATQYIDEVIYNLTSTGKENIPLLQNVLLFAHMEKKKFNMNSWIGGSNNLDTGSVTKDKVLDCGTTMCLAGTAAVLTMGKDERLLKDYNKIVAVSSLSPYGGEYISTRGQNVLGLTDRQAKALFHLPNNIEVVTAACNYIAQTDLLEGVLTNA